MPKNNLIEKTPKIRSRLLMLPSAIARSHLTRLILIALELQHQGGEDAIRPENR
ncbi:hypothetical protein QUB56_16100 [Microcoleus sp. AR_TQ3_B6]|uniref:hypothetical protein n=1 Tax=Microcoleus sp. AR_TQ3_B6 TaxID=3055284 RepID=UPI002FD71B03